MLHTLNSSSDRIVSRQNSPFVKFVVHPNDESGNGNNGIVNGSTLINDRFGNGYSVYNFNGIDNCIQINDNLQLRPSVLTISIWLNGNEFIRFEQLLTKSASSGNNESINLIINNIDFWNLTAQVVHLVN